MRERGAGKGGGPGGWPVADSGGVNEARGASTARRARQCATVSDSREDVGRCDRKRSIVPRDELKGRRGWAKRPLHDRSLVSHLFAAIMQSRSTRLCCCTIR